MVWPFNRRKKQEKEEAPAPATELLDDGPALPPPTFQAQPDSSELLPDFQGSSSSFSSSSTPPPPRYNPYEGLPSTLDPGMLNKLYNLPEAPEYLFDEEARVQRRSASENLTYCTGVGYFTGSILGGGYGALKGLKPPTAGIPDTSKLRLNRVLNGASNRGMFFGNTIVVLGLFYAASDSFMVYMRDGEDDALNQVAAGAAAGMMFKATSGPRAIMVYGSAGGALALGATLASGVGRMMSYA